MEFTVNWIIFSAIAIVIGSSAETRKLFCSNSRIYFDSLLFQKRTKKSPKIFPCHFGYFGYAQMTFSWHWDWFLFIGGSRTIWYEMHCKCSVRFWMYLRRSCKSVYIYWKLLLMTTRQFCKCISSFFFRSKKEGSFSWGKFKFKYTKLKWIKWITHGNIVHDPYASVCICASNSHNATVETIGMSVNARCNAITHKSERERDEWTSYHKWTYVQQSVLSAIEIRM